MILRLEITGCSYALFHEQLPGRASGCRQRSGANSYRDTENNLVVFSGKNKVKAYEVVAPGQSGFIAPDGTPSPHYQDQLSLYENFDYKETWLNKKDVKAHTRSTETINSDR